MTHATPKRKAAGGFETTTATINNFKRTLALYARTKGIFVRFASWLAVMFRGIV
jgi:hypothetical protein